MIARWPDHCLVIRGALIQCPLAHPVQLGFQRREDGVGIVIVAVILTPPDVASALMLAVPMWMLFEGSLIFMLLGERRAAKEAEGAED